MKAAVLYGNNDIRYEEYETPTVTAGTVRVRVRAAGICGSDIPRVLHNGVHFYPIILGHEFSGVIDAVGEGVDGLSVGDTVSVAPLLPCMECADCVAGNFSLCRHYSFIGSRQAGAFADYVVVPAINAVKYDPSIPFIKAAMFEPATVALHGLLTADYRSGGDVAVIGGGTIGLFALQFAKIFGAKTVTVIDPVKERRELAHKLGSDHSADPIELTNDDIKAKFTGGCGFDTVIEAAGNPTTVKNAFALAGNRATVSLIGTPHGEVKFSNAEWEQLNRKELKVVGSWMSYSAPYPGREWELTAHLLADGRLKIVDEMIDRVFPMSKAPDAFALFNTPANVKGKIMLINE